MVFRFCCALVLASRCDFCCTFVLKSLAVTRPCREHLSFTPCFMAAPVTLTASKSVKMAAPSSLSSNWATVVGDRAPLVRAECQLGSQEIGRLPLGTKVYVLREEALADGICRALIKREGEEKPYGWITSTSKGNHFLEMAAPASTISASLNASKMVPPPASPVNCFLWTLGLTSRASGGANIG